LLFAGAPEHLRKKQAAVLRRHAGVVLGGLVFPNAGLDAAHAKRMYWMGDALAVRPATTTAGFG
jgi:hypothetical protein